MRKNLEECPTCGGEGAVIVSEVCDQYDRVHLQWDTCRTCGGEGAVEIEEEDE
jgi:DnaJ-class molecular chaperone